MHTHASSVYSETMLNCFSHRVCRPQCFHSQSFKTICQKMYNSLVLSCLSVNYKAIKKPSLWQSCFELLNGLFKSSFVLCIWIKCQSIMSNSHKYHKLHHFWMSVGPKLKNGPHARNIYVCEFVLFGSKVTNAPRQIHQTLVPSENIYKWAS